jgi:glycosyltransferase involved in cell wall biosynthesis
VVVPAFNEGAVIEQTVGGLRAAFDSIVVVDDCSDDRTGEAALAMGAHVCRHPVNLGQGAALATGIEYALGHGADAIVTFDGDGQHSVEDARRFVDILTHDKVDIVLGSRFLGDAPGISPARRAVLKAAILYTRLTTGLALTDTHNGLRCMTADTARRLVIRQNRMAHASEILETISRLGLRYVEAACTTRYTDYSTAKGQRMTGAFAIVSDLLIGRLYR